jgi:FKBP-type peptidyl-prolyl cis-trans isomerase
MKSIIFCCMLFCASVSNGAAAQLTENAADTAWVHTKSGLAYLIIVKGTGPMPAAGQRVTIHETLSLPDGKVIFSSRATSKPVTFELGANQVIPGVEEGVTGMRVGERRKLLVPPALDGRTFDPSFIPPQAMRHYDIELVAIAPKP